MASVTVAAVILFARLEGALANADGRSAARRIVESAWAGGATPLIVVSFDQDGQVAATLAGSPAVLAEPAPPENGPVGQISRGITVAAQHVTETDAALVWPGRMAWVDAETVTTLIEAHGANREAILRPRYDNVLGWPALLPVTMLPALSAQAPTRMPDELLHDLVTGGVQLMPIDTGDPGVVHDISTAIDALPPYDGPPQPVAGPAPEWGAAAADMPDDSPPEGPTLAPYAQAADER
jgi:CTP:molybdopterin cytidylyltransferase MocA